MQSTSMGIRPRILLPFTLVMLILIVGFGVIFFTFQRAEVEKQSAEEAEHVTSLLQSQIDQEAALMVSQLSFLTGNTALQNAYMSQDRDVLLGHATPIFERLRENNLVTHFYFTGLDRVNFLRVHNPPKLGDTIGRHTTLEAERTGDIAYGVELGASGMFTLRVVTPWVVNGERIGYMELGMEIDHIISRIHENVEADLVVLIEKEYANQENWEQGMQALGRPADWDMFTDVVLIDSTLANVERVIDDDTVTLISTTDDANFDVAIDDRRLSAHNVPLLSANGEEVGELIVFSDITDVTDNLMSTSLNAVLIAVMVFIVAFVFLYIYVGSISRRQSDLIDSLQVVNEELESQATLSENQVRQLETMNVEIQERATVEQSQHQALLNLAVEVRDAVQVLNEAAMEIQASATQQVANITEQDAAVTQTSATVDQVHSTVQKTAERALQVAESAQESVEVSQRGESAVSDTIEGMEMIRRQVNNIAETILSLSEHTQQIGEIIETVSSIADQSKLLSLNASIEAARASEEGRGFAVVAAEVRELAEQSKMATDRISSILSEIQQATNTAVMVTEEGSKGVDRGMTLVNSAGLAIRDLADMVREATHAAVEISNDTRSQIDSVRQLAAAMQQIKEASLQTAASSRQTERSARNLTVTSMRLEQAITEYNID